MIKHTTYLCIFFLFFVNLTIAQDKLNNENADVLEQLINHLNEGRANSYLLSFDDGYDDAFLIYKYKNNFIIDINEYTYFTTNINSSDFKNAVTRLKGKNIMYKEVGETTGEIIKKIPSYKFTIPQKK